MEKVVTHSKSFEESDRSDKAFYPSLTPRERLEILFELNSRWPKNPDEETSQGLQRVYRIIKLS